MKRIGNEIYIQRGEDWSLDFDVKNAQGDPMMIFKLWRNPYLAITITAALYEQEGDFRETYWLDLNNRWVEHTDGSMTLEPIKKFISLEALALPSFNANDIVAIYGADNGGQIVFDHESDFDVTNYLFYTDPYNDGNRVYRYITSYELNEHNEAINVIWEDYNFRIIKQFATKNWMEQGYFFDIKLLAGESLQEHVSNLLTAAGEVFTDDIWSDEQMQLYINRLRDETERTKMQELFDEGWPLMPEYNTKMLILDPTRLYVSANIQGGVGR